jgi:hypothetical protein
MKHRPLPDIRKYALITNQKSEFYAIVKPEGLDVYVNDGKFFDFNHNELQNQFLQFHFEDVLKTSRDQRMTIIGTLTAPNILDVKRYKGTLYGKTRSQFPTLKFVVYDSVFPTFNSDHIFKWRYDIADKVIGKLPNCLTAHKDVITNDRELHEVVKSLFAINTGASVLVYKTDGNFVPGMSQLMYDDNDTVSYIVQANQRYRAHIKKVVSTTLKFDDTGDKIDVALYIIAKFKRDFIEIPIDQSNMALRRFIWENRLALKEYPFWFTGYTLLDNKDGVTDYVTTVNEFLSFITTPENGD